MCFLALGLGSLSSLVAACGLGGVMTPNPGVERLRGVADSANRISAGGGPEIARSRASATPPSAPGDAPTRAEVLAGWRSAELAYETAVSTADASEPALAATIADPQLTFTREVLTGMDAAGEAASGTVALGNPTVVGVSGDEASVRSCIHDAEVVYFRTTGRPVPGVAGRVADELVVSVMLRREGEWKLVDQAVRADACVAK